MYNSKAHMRVVVLSVRTDSCWRQLHVKAATSRRAASWKYILQQSRDESLWGRTFKIELTLNRTNKPLLKSLCLQQACQTHFHLEPYRRHGCPQRGRLWIKLFKSNHSLTLCCRLGVWILPYLFKLPRNTQKQAQNLSMHHINEPELLNPKNKHKQTS